MASVTSGYIGKIDPGNGTQYSLGSTAYGYCETAAATAAKTVAMTGFTLTTGATIFVRFKYENTATTPTLNVNSTGAKSMVSRHDSSSASNLGTTDNTTGWEAGAILCLTYDGTYWVRNQGNNTDTNTDTKVTQAYSTTNNSYPLLLTATAGISSTDSRGATTTILNNSLYANPSTGLLRATKIGINGTNTDASTDHKLYVNGSIRTTSYLRATTSDEFKYHTYSPTTDVTGASISASGLIYSCNNYITNDVTNAGDTGAGGFKIEFAGNTFGRLFVRTETLGRLHLGNSTANGNSGGASGGILLYGTGTNYLLIQPTSLADNITIGASTNSSSVTTLSINQGVTISSGDLTISSGVITQSSDKNVKHNIQDISNQYNTLFDNLSPKQFKYNNDIIDRNRFGFVAQEIEEAYKKAQLDYTKDSIITKHENTKNGEWDFNITDIIPLNTWQIQQMKKEIQTLKQEVIELRKLVNSNG